ncbi:hypothetical protein A9996_18665 [Gelidibacter algens]|nr:hypothetical protein A9996_18665 [Gelidibacter algens]
MVRIFNGTIPRFADFLSVKGLPFTNVLVWLITGYEIIGGMALMIGYYSKCLSIGFIIILVLGILLIHIASGWFVGEHGTGGVEYSFILIVALLVIMSSKK